MLTISTTYLTGSNLFLVCAKLFKSTALYFVFLLLTFLVYFVVRLLQFFVFFSPVGKLALDIYSQYPRVAMRPLRGLLKTKCLLQLLSLLPFLMFLLPQFRCDLREWDSKGRGARVYSRRGRVCFQSLGRQSTRGSCIELVSIPGRFRFKGERNKFCQAMKTHL